MNRRLRLSTAGRERYERWRDAHATDPDDIPLVQQVLLTIAEDGWPPTHTHGGPPAPRWPYFRDPANLEHTIIAPSGNLWVVIRLAVDTFDFVTAIHPTPEQEELAPWLTDPSDAEGPYQ